LEKGFASLQGKNIKQTNMNEQKNININEIFERYDEFYFTVLRGQERNLVGLSLLINLYNFSFLAFFDE